MSRENTTENDTPPLDDVIPCFMMYLLVKGPIENWLDFYAAVIYAFADKEVTVLECFAVHEAVPHISKVKPILVEERLEEKSKDKWSRSLVQKTRDGQPGLFFQTAEKFSFVQRCWMARNIV